jgi:uncharacterized protein YjeT (DUF2065 family)
MKQRQRKSLSYQIVSNTPLLSVEEEIKKDLVIRYRGKEVQKVDLVVVRIVNTGNLPIAAKDFDRPITLDLGEGAQILTAEISERKPDELQPSINVEQSKIKLEPILLNQGDAITFKMLVTGSTNKIKFDFRIVGVEKIGQLSEDSLRFVIPALAGTILLVVGLIMAFIGSIQSESTLQSQGIVTLFIGSGLMYVGMLWDKQTRKRIERLVQVFQGA